MTASLGPHSSICLAFKIVRPLPVGCRPLLIWGTREKSVQAVVWLHIGVLGLLCQMALFVDLCPHMDYNAGVGGLVIS